MPVAIRRSTRTLRLETKGDQKVGRALILEGGGSKGAFAAGALKALNENGVSFDFVSGTSIGAIHALYYSVGATHELESKWGDIRLRRVWRIRKSSFLIILNWISKLLCFAFVIRSKNSKTLLVGWLVILYLAFTLKLLLSPDSNPRIPFPYLNAIAFILAFLVFFVPRQNYSLFSPEPLENELKEIIETYGRPSVPTYVTMSMKREVFDPRHPTFIPVLTSDPLTMAWNPHEVFVPKYIRIDTLPTVEIVNAVVASAAIPWSLVKSSSIQNERMVDGGVVDNSPLLPIIENHSVNSAIVIALSNDTPAKCKCDFKKHVRKVKRLIEVAQQSDEVFNRFTKEYGNDFGNPFSAKNTVKGAKNWIVDPKITNWPNKIETLVPRKDSSGTIFEALNFSNAKAEQLYWQGYDLAKRSNYSD